VPFTGRPYDKLIEKDKHAKVKAKVFTLPDVQVGSILEYRITLEIQSYLYSYPSWYVQRHFSIRKAHYDFMPDQRDPPEYGKYASVLPKGTKVQYDAKRRIYSLDIDNVEPLLDEDFTPPIESVSYRVLFYYTRFNSPEEYWKAAGDIWNKNTDEFMKSNKLAGVAGQIVQPNDTPRQKAQKIYDAVMKLENTSFTREQSRAENKAHKVKTKTAEDIWNAKRGDADEIAVLYVGLARAAGLKAYAAQVTDRSRALFLQNFLSIDQFDDYIAIVELDGKEEFLDPGERYCSFGDLDWKHAGTGGLRQTDHGAVLTSTPPLGYKSTRVFRNADLTLDSSGQVKGSFRIGMTGSEALALRQQALRSDEEAMKTDFEKHLKDELPEGIEARIDHIIGLTDYNSVLMIVVELSGSMGTKTGKRMLVPAQFFEASAKSLLVESKRANPIDLYFPYAKQDNVVIHLPPSVEIESAPKEVELTLPHNALYRSSFKKGPGKLEASRLFLFGNVLYRADEYSALKDFFQKVNANDQEQLILQSAPAVASGDVSTDARVGGEKQ